MRGSVPAKSRLMFSEWRIQTRAPRPDIKTIMSDLPNTKSQNRTPTAVASAAKDEKRKRAAKASHVRHAAAPTEKDKASKVPR